MSTKKQISANRQNARKSTGPKPNGGKKIVRFNALQHGLTQELVWPASARGARPPNVLPQIFALVP
jgi:hypothetical protein